VRFPIWYRSIKQIKTQLLLEKNESFNKMNNSSEYENDMFSCRNTTI